MATPRAWTVDPHGPIEKLETNLWAVEGAIPNMPLLRRMTLARLRDGQVVVHNAIAMEESAMRALEAWGEPKYIVVPNAFHRLDAHAWKLRYPKASVLCPSGAETGVAKMLPVDGVYETFKGDETVRLEVLDGVRKFEGVMIVQSEGGTTLTFNDMLFNHPHCEGTQGFVMKVLGSTGGPRVTRIARLFLMKNRAAFVAHLKVLAATRGLVRAVPGHGGIITHDVAGVLHSVADALT